MTITRASFERRPFLLPKFAWNARLKSVQTARRELRRPWLRNARGDRCMAGMTHGIASADAGSGTGNGTDQTREKIDGSHRKGGGEMTMKKG
jgi:hypothetical protein